MKTLTQKSRRGVRAVLALVLSVAGVLGANTPAQAACRQALAIGLDVSGSVDATEYRLQMDGLAAALLTGDVQAAFLAMPDINVRLLVYEWGGDDSQNLLVPWTEITSSDDLQAVAQTLRSTQRQAARLSTALGQAMLFGADALANQTDCWRRTIDLSGDGESNSGPRPRSVSDDPAFFGVTINAIVIGADALPYSDISQSEIAQLSSYFRSEVIRGPNAFVETAIEFVGFQDAMAKKLLKELQTRAVGRLVPPDQ
ncbi:MAG: DUF1194 domain-containing protein [Paracoccaceae bacterium]